MIISDFQKIAKNIKTIFKYTTSCKVTHNPSLNYVFLSCFSFIILFLIYLFILYYNQAFSVIMHFFFFVIKHT